MIQFSVLPGYDPKSLRIYKSDSEEEWIIIYFGSLQYSYTVHKDSEESFSTLLKLIKKNIENDNFELAISVLSANFNIKNVSVDSSPSIERPTLANKILKFFR